MQLVGIGLLRQDRGAVVVGEGGLDCVDVVGEIEHEGIVLVLVRPVETGERLHRLDAGERLVNVHRVQQRLVVAGLKLVGADQEAIGRFLNARGDLGRGKAVERSLADLRPPVLVLAGKGDDSAVGAVALHQIGANGFVVADGELDAARHHHRPRPAPYLLQAGYLLMEVVDHDLGLEADGVVVVLDIAAQLFSGALHVELRVAHHRLDQPVVAVDRRVVGQHVDDEALLDRLLHRVDVEGPMPDRAALGNRACRRSRASCFWAWQ